MHFDCISEIHTATRKGSCQDWEDYVWVLALIISVIITKSFNFQIGMGSLLLTADFVQGPNSMGGGGG